jgi:DNA mismatch repair protein MSH3
MASSQSKKKKQETPSASKSKQLSINSFFFKPKKAVVFIEGSDWTKKKKNEEDRDDEGDDNEKKRKTMTMKEAPKEELLNDTTVIVSSDGDHDGDGDDDDHGMKKKKKKKMMMTEEEVEEVDMTDVNEKENVRTEGFELERDLRKQKAFTAKLIARATAANDLNTVSGRGYAFKKQREEEERDIGTVRSSDERLDRVNDSGGEKKTLTPLEMQVKEFKEKYPDVLLLFEVGYKFHFYGKDARKAAETLNVFAYPGKTWLQASGPVHRLAVYVRRLVIAGEKVGVVRQTETAALKAEGSTKGSVFTRELVALYTRATMDAGVSIAAEMEQNEIGKRDSSSIIGEEEEEEERKKSSGDDNNSNDTQHQNQRRSVGLQQCGQQLSNYLLCISEERNEHNNDKVEIALVAIDTSVGNVFHAQFEDDSSRSRLESALLKIAPCEILWNNAGEILKESKRLITALFPDARVEQSQSMQSSLSIQEIHEYFGVANAEMIIKFPRLLISTFAAAREYLVPFKLENVLKLAKSIRPLDDVKSEMILSPNTIRQLEIFRNSDDGSFNGSLLWLIDHAKSKSGSRELSRWVSRPLRDRAEIDKRSSAIETLREMNNNTFAVAILEKIEETLKKSPDVERVIARTHHLNATPAEFVSAMQFFITFGKVCEEMRCALQQESFTKTSVFLDELLSACADEATIQTCEKALQALDLDRANSKAGNLGCSRDAYVGLFVSDNDDNLKAFPEVFLAQKNLESSKTTMDALLPSLAAQIPGMIKGAKLSYTSVGGASGAEFLIEINDKLKPPNDWIKVSANKSKKVIRYHPPDVLENMKSLEANNERLALACESAWKKFLSEFSRVSYGECRQAAKATAKIDALNSLAILSMNDGYCRPEFFDDDDDNAPARIEIVNGRHPTLDAKMVDKFVPNSTSLNIRTRAMILTGPNMGGKSCFARQVALVAILAHIGSFVPAQSCRLSVLDGIYTRAGAADNLALGQSTFFQEMSETSAILKSCTKKSLVILDELGRGTSTSDGYAIASATLRLLVTKVQCPLVFVTHFSNLAKTFFDEHSNEVFCCFPSFMKQNDDANDDEKKITFLYSLTEGVAHRSFGLNVASMAGLPTKVIDVAEQKSLAFETRDLKRMLKSALMKKM